MIVYFNFPLINIFFALFSRTINKVETWYTYGEWADVLCSMYARIKGVKSLDRFYIAMLTCSTVILSGKHEFKMFQHYGYFSSDSTAAGL